MDNSTQDGPMKVSDANFQAEVIEASKSMPVFLDVFAEWCPPCKAIAPIVEKFAKDDFKDKVKFVKLNSDESTAVVQQYGIRSIPTLMVFVNGQKMVQQPGALSEPMMKDFINKYAFGGASAMPAAA